MSMYTKSEWEVPLILFWEGAYCAMPRKKYCLFSNHNIKQIKWHRLFLTCAPISKLSYNISTMVIRKFKIVVYNNDKEHNRGTLLQLV